MDKPKPKDYTDFDSFDSNYQDWLDSLDDEAWDKATIMSTSDIWEQYQEDLNNANS